MINFRQLVLEAITSPALISDFVKDGTELTNLKSKLSIFGIDQAILSKLDSAWYHILDEHILIRTTLDDISSDTYVNVFPYVDFLSYFKENNLTPTAKFEKDKFDKVNVDKVEGLFLANFGTYASNSHPFFDYKPQSLLLKGEYDRIKSHMLERNLIGKKTVENFINNNFTLKKACYELANLRHDASKPTVPSDDKKFNEVIINPNSFISGAQKLKPLPESIPSSSANSFIILFSLIKRLADAEKATDVLDFINKKTIKDLSTSSASEAKDIIKKMQELGNIIPKIKPVDWMKGIEGVAKVGLKALGLVDKIGGKIAT